MAGCITSGLVTNTRGLLIVLNCPTALGRLIILRKYLQNITSHRSFKTLNDSSFRHLNGVTSFISIKNVFALLMFQFHLILLSSKFYFSLIVALRNRL
jgi:hypothetical protein